jgi:hypothetical protein
VQNLLSSNWLCKNINITIYINTTLPVVLFGFESWYLTLSEEHLLRVLRRIFGAEWKEIAVEKST